MYFRSSSVVPNRFFGFLLRSSDLTAFWCFRQELTECSALLSLCPTRISHLPRLFLSLPSVCILPLVRLIAPDRVLSRIASVSLYGCQRHPRVMSKGYAQGRGLSENQARVERARRFQYIYIYIYTCVYMYIYMTCQFPEHFTYFLSLLRSRKPYTALK